ncbi:phage tail spike protein [Streptococcus sp. H31]|uniref:phage tail spike protein n=1 Tax=Streptococcus huangxiaojuni TaxID=3237239 RepID=UPI0034A51609
MIYLFDNQERLIKLIRRTAIKSLSQTQTLTDTKYVSDRMTAEVKVLPDNLLEEAEYIAIPTQNSKNQYHFYFLAAHETDAGVTTLEGTQVGIEELRKTTIKDIRPNNSFPRPVIDRLLTGTNWQARNVFESIRASTTFYYLSIFEALQKVCEVWSLEMQFFVEISGNEITAKYIDFRKQIGANAGKRVVWGHNALKIIHRAEKTDLVTAVIGRGRGEQVSSAEETGNEADGYGRKITFADVVWTKPKNPVDKPLGQEYVELPSATAIYGIKTPKGMMPKVGMVEFDTDDKADLLQRTYQYLLEKSHPQVTFKTTAAYLNAGIGDRVRVVRRDRNLDYTTRVFEVTIDRLTNLASDIKLGDRLNVSEALRAQQLARQLSDTVIRSTNNHVTALISANGLNTNWYSDGTPPAEKVKSGDIWYRLDPENETERIMYYWDGENWIEILRTSDTDTVQKALDEMQPKLEEAANNAVEHNQKLNDAYAQAEVANNLAEEAKKTASENNSKLNAVKETVDTYVRTIGSTEGEIGAKISQLVMTDSAFVTRVGDLTFGETGNLIADPVEFTNYAAINPKDSLKISKVNWGSYKGLKIAVTDGTANVGFKIPLTKNVLKAGTYSYRIRIVVDKLTDLISIALGTGMQTDDSPISINRWIFTTTGSRVVIGSFTLDKDMTFDTYPFRVYLKGDGQIAVQEITLVKGTTVPTTFIRTEDSTASISEVSQLAGSWAVRNLNSSGDVLNQINLNKDGSVLIDGSLVRITGKTVIDDATIASSKLINVSADKITTGTLNAGNVNVINLNASNITTGTMTANRINGGILTANNGRTTFNLNNGRLDMDNNGEGWGTAYDAAGISFYGGSTRMVSWGGYINSSKKPIGTLLNVAKGYKYALTFGNYQGGGFEFSGDDGSVYMNKVRANYLYSAYYGTNESNGLRLIRGQTYNVWGTGIESTVNNGAGIYFRDDGRFILKSRGTVYDFNDMWNTLINTVTAIFNASEPKYSYSVSFPSKLP